MTAKELYRWRVDHNHSQASLAKALRKNVRQVIRWEMGNTPIPYEVELVLKNEIVSHRPESESGRWPGK